MILLNWLDLRQPHSRSIFMPSLLIPLVAFCRGRSFMGVVLTLEQCSVKLICVAHGVGREYHICVSSLINPCRQQTKSPMCNCNSRRFFPSLTLLRAQFTGSHGSPFKLGPCSHSWKLAWLLMRKNRIQSLYVHSDYQVMMHGLLKIHSTCNPR
jgi:hypothetical protein